MPLTIVNETKTTGMHSERQVPNAVEALHTALVKVNKTTLDELLCMDLSYGHSNGAGEEKITFIQDIMNGISIL